MRETFEEFDYKFRFVAGNPEDADLSKKITSFLAAASTVRKRKDARMGMLGYVSMGMYTGLGDHIKVKQVFGTKLCICSSTL
jgi:L-fucose isomerase-like protein